MRLSVVVAMYAGGSDRSGGVQRGDREGGDERSGARVAPVFTVV